jgi:hypothetical protein
MKKHILVSSLIQLQEVPLGRIWLLNRVWAGKRKIHGSRGNTCSIAKAVQAFPVPSLRGTVWQVNCTHQLLPLSLERGTELLPLLCNSEIIFIYFLILWLALFPTKESINRFTGYSYFQIFHEDMSTLCSMVIHLLYLLSHTESIKGKYATISM